MQGARGLLIETLFQTGARVSEFVSIKAEDGFLDEQMILTAKAKGGKNRHVPIREELLLTASDFASFEDRFREALHAAKRRSAVALKSIVAYRSGLAV